MPPKHPSYVHIKFIQRDRSEMMGETAGAGFQDTHDRAKSTNNCVGKSCPSTPILIFANFSTSKSEGGLIGKATSGVLIRCFDILQ